jgi:two-component system alkaline phosphatase synthesis response regulator PhoP
MTPRCQTVTHRHVTFRDPAARPPKTDGAGTRGDGATLRSNGNGSGGDGGPSRVLLVIGTALANLVAVTLRHGNYETRQAVTEGEVRARFKDWGPHLALVDIDEHNTLIAAVGGGMSRGGIPILAFTRRREAVVKLAAYEDGADDIVEVPFTLDEIIARPYALIRRSRGITVPLVPRITLGGELDVDLINQTVKLANGRALQLTPIQQTLLYILAANAGAVLTREILLNTIWGKAFQIESNVVDRHIRELRVKLGDDWRSPLYIETVPGEGYRFSTKNGRAGETVVRQTAAPSFGDGSE